MDKNFDGFFKANEARIHYQLQRLGIFEETKGEFYSEGIIALWKGFKNHDETKGNVGTFLNYQIRYRLMDLLRKKTRADHRDERACHGESLKINDGNYYCNTGEPIPDPRGIILESDAFWKEVRRDLSANQWKWVEYFIIADLSIKEIMEIENVSAQAVKSWAREVRRKLRHEGIQQKLEELL